MNQRLFWSSACRLAITSLLLAFVSPVAEAKPIRLRTETIDTPGKAQFAASSRGKALAAQGAASGLFLIQFEGPVAPARRAELRSLGVRLIKYVPDDAFIARLNRISLGTVTALADVQWVGPYRPDHKINPRLAASTRAGGPAHRVLSLNVVVSPDATGTELAQVRSIFTRVIHESKLRQGTIVRGDLAAASLDALSQSAEVLWIEQAPKRKLVDEAASKIVGGDDGFVATPTVSQQLGFDGTGVTVCVADTGLDSGDTNAMHPDLSGRVTGFLHYGTNIVDGSDGYGHGTHCAGIVAGNAATGETDPDFGTLYGLGVASGANLLVQRIFDDDANQADPFPSDETLTGDAVRNGADIGSNSWGNDTQGEYDTDASQFDELVRDADPSTPGDQPYILEFSSGNAGPDSQTVGSTATGKNVITTGASQNTPGIWALTYGLYADGPDTMADFSSRGPCADGRIKPDIVAPGTWIASAASSAAPNEDAIAWTPIDSYYVYMGGTSMSGPHAAGAAAVFVQYYKSLHTNAVPSPALVKASLINSATVLDPLNGGPGPIPNHDEGWGRVTLTNIIFTNLSSAPRYYENVDQTVLLTDGQLYVHHSLVRSSGQPLKITLAYTDVAGFPGAIPALVNDLDLEVVAPDGTVYRGNQFAGDDSFPNPPSADNLNNVEAVHLAHPVPGDYEVRVRASHIVQDARLGTAAIDQDFALVVSGDLARPSAGSILLDRASYTAPDRVKVSVFDLSRAGQGTVNVTVKSTTESAGETYALQASGNYGAFTGAVLTATGPAATDGKLQVQHGNLIEADYLDTFSALRSATAAADLVAPTITGVSVSTDLGVIAISWQTTEPSSSLVVYGTNLTFSLAATNTALVSSHSIRLTRLVPGQNYSFYVVSTDAAGNSTTNNQSGAYYSFVGIATPTVLFVDAYDPVAGSPDIPDSTYTNALAAAGFSFAHWKVSQRGSPQLSDLRAFPVVMWRVIDDIINYGVDEDGFPDPSATNNTLSAQQQVMIGNYLAGGGSFFMSSMNILSMLGNVPFRKNVLQVGGFKQNPDPPSACANCDEYFGVPAINGQFGEPVAGQVNTALDYNNYPSIDLFDFFFGPDFSDTYTPGTNATAILYESDSGKPCGMSYPRIGVDSPGRVVFLSFPIDAVPDTGNGPSSRATLLGNILKFLTPGVDGAGTMFLDNTTYSVPDQVIVEVGDTDLEGAGQTQALFSTSGGTNHVLLTLNETTHPGLFRGYLALVATNAPDKLKVSNGDTITAQYFDASRNSNVIVNATIDTVPPVIDAVSSTTRFGDATVTWTTSKPSDSLVQFGESVILSRTAYAPQLVTNHVVSITSLAANRDYYFQVTSRDAAGNATIDDNGSALYTFTTQKAPQPPWFDDLESGAVGWSVVPDSSGTDLNWTLGVPNNTLDNSAYSPDNAWASNLDGSNFAFLESSFLYSPFIDLSGLSSATLTFWHSFDSSAGLEFLELGVSTNSSTPPADIPTLVSYTGQSSFGWEQASVSLNAFLGKTVQIVWYYAGVDIGTPPPGWMVDDVRIEGNAIGTGGTITIAKNLGQGTWTVHGPVNQSGTAPSAIISNAPAGPYTVSFSDVAFYQTPLMLSNNLTAGGTLNFAGNYDFLDFNGNGMSDSWEKYYLGSAPPDRTRFTDSDGDGMTDYGEFIAGTNPTNPASKLVLLGATVLTNRQLQLAWAAIPGRLYQVQTSGLQSTPPLPTVSGSMTNAGSGFALRIESPANIAYTIQFSTNLTSWSSVLTNQAGGTLDWLDSTAAQSAHRYYRTMVSSGAATNFQGWTPVSDWLRAPGSPMYYSVSSTNTGAHAYRVQVRP